MDDDCTACGHGVDDHLADGDCWRCGRAGCPDGYIPPESTWAPADDHDPIPGLRIRFHGTSP